LIPMRCDWDAITTTGGQQTLQPSPENPQDLQHPELAAALQAQVLAPRHRLLGQLLESGVRRGEVRPDALTPECIEVGPALIRQHFIESGQQPSEEAVRQDRRQRPDPDAATTRYRVTRALTGRRSAGSEPSQ